MDLQCNAVFFAEMAVSGSRWWVQDRGANFYCGHNAGNDQTQNAKNGLRGSSARMNQRLGLGSFGVALPFLITSIAKVQAGQAETIL
jgi:hypothetical protein